MNFTEEEIEFMQRLRTKDMGYGNIARRLEAVYRKKPTVSQVKRALATPEEKQANTEIAAMALPTSLRGVVKLRQEGATYKEITEQTGFNYKKVKSICDVFVENNSEISRNNMSRYRAEKKKVKKPQKTKRGKWSEKDTAELILLKQQGLSYREIAQKLRRTDKACQLRYHRTRENYQPNTATFEEVVETVEEPIQIVEKKLQKGLDDIFEQIREEVKTHGVAISIPEMKEEPTPEPKEKKWANNRCNYTPQQELEIMVDFPNLSIDEMREKYQRDYRALAGRYEDIWDSEEPSRIAIVMEASRIVAARKAEEEQKQTEPRMGWFERRRMKRVARKAAKIQKRLDKMATKYGVILSNGDE